MPHEIRRPLPLLLEVLLVLFLALCTPLAKAQELLPRPSPGTLIEAGVPDYKILGPEALGLDTTPSGMHYMPDGRLLVYSVRQLAMGDGVRWESFHLHPTVNPPGISSIMTGDDGLLYALCSRDGNSFARVSIDKHGYLELVDLQDLTSLEQPHHPAFALRHKKGWLPMDGPLPRAEINGMVADLRPAHLITRIFALRGKVYASDRADGRLYVVEGNHLLPALPQTMNSGDYSVTGIASYDQDHLLLSTTGKGLFLFDGNAITPFPLSISGLVSRRLGDLCKTTDGFFALAVENQGIVFLNKGGSVLHFLNTHHDHRFASVRQLMAGPGNSIWALIGTGLAQIQFPSPVTHMEPLAENGFQFALPIRHAGGLWLCTDGTALRAVYNAFGQLERFVSDSPPGAYVLSLHSAPSLGLLLAGTGNGLYSWKEGTWTRQIADIPALRLVKCLEEGRRWCYVARNEVGWISQDNGSFSIQRFPQEKLNDAYGAIMDKNGVAWLELGAGRCARVDFNAASPVAENFTSADGLAQGWVQLFLFRGKAVAMASGRTLSFDSQSHRFIPEQLLTGDTSGLMHGRMALDASGRLWASTNTGVRVYDISGPVPVLLPRGRIEGFRPFYIVAQEDGVLWMHRSNVLLRYDPRLPEPPPPKLRTLITKAQLTADNLTLSPRNGALDPVDYSSNSIAFTFCTPGAPLSEVISFETKLEGGDGEWLPAGNTGRTVFTRLKEGPYVLHVRAKAGDLCGEPTTLSFEIRPPWFRTNAAYLAYGLCALATMALVAWLASFLERREKRRLSHLVEELNVANVRLNESNHELEAFSYSVSHDLRAPLRNIGGFADLLGRRHTAQLDDTGRHYVEVISTEAQRLGHLIDSLLAFSRVQRTEMKPVSCDLNLIIGAIRNELMRGLENRKVEWRIAQLPKIQGDPTLLRQVFMNLLSNALKFTRQRDPALIEIGVETPAVDQGDPCQVFFVRDNGAGFDPRHADKLFGVFQRLHSPKDFEGTGIGLANVKRIISRHGGRVWAESTPGKGATFRIALPTST